MINQQFQNKSLVVIVFIIASDILGMINERNIILPSFYLTQFYLISVNRINHVMQQAGNNADTNPAHLTVM